MSSAFLCTLISPSRYSHLGLCHSDGFNPNKLIYLSISANSIIWCGLWSNPGVEPCKEVWDHTYVNTVLKIARCWQHSQMRTSSLVLSWSVSSGWFEIWLIIILIYLLGCGWVMRSGGGRVWVSTPNVQVLGRCAWILNPAICRKKGQCHMCVVFVFVFFHL